VAAKQGVSAALARRYVALAPNKTRVGQIDHTGSITLAHHA
jgi:hypothetical protein